MKKSKERREEPLGTMSYQTSSKRSPPFWLLIGARKTQDFSEPGTGYLGDCDRPNHLDCPATHQLGFKDYMTFASWLELLH